MKSATQALNLVVLAACISAQDADTLEGTTTIFYSVCPTAATLTTTLSSTLTLCPGPYCNGGSPSITLASGMGGIIAGGYTTVGPNGESTVYETIYPNTCSTGGLQDVTYYITEPCPCQETRATDYVPSGFSTTEAIILTNACDTCSATETTITLTTPCSTGPYAEQTANTPGATAQVGSPTAAAPASSGNTGTVPAATGAGTGGNGGAGGNGTISPSITPMGSNAASPVGSTPMSSFTGAAHKIDVVGFSAHLSVAFMVGAAAWVL